MLDIELDDEAKERAVRQAGLQLLKLSWQILWRIVLALAAVGAPIAAASLAGLVQQEESLEVLMRLDFLIIVSLIAIGLGLIVGRWKGSSSISQHAAETSLYGGGDRLVHALAFSGPRLQMALARLDDGLFSRSLVDTPDSPPIFITSLARGGTTALLNALHDMPGIATHRYADMPFISAPMLWSRLAGRRAHVAERERSHGDGLQIGLQSPEAFDEVLWMLHWPEKYRQKHIELWRADDLKPEAQTFFARHFAKIKSLRQPESGTAARYLGKNNANIARLDLLPGMFPACQIVVPLREPSAHAASLLRQHLNFTRLHSDDAFSKRYMRDIGHFEFGELHRPFAFDRDFLARFKREQPDYWLAYWITCFEHVEKHADNLLIVMQDDLRDRTAPTMEALITQLGLNDDSSKRWESYFRQEPDARRDGMFNASLLARARGVFEKLRDSHSNTRKRSLE